MVNSVVRVSSALSALLGITIVLTGATAVAQIETPEQQKVLPKSGEDWYYYGRTVAVDGAWAAVAAEEGNGEVELLFNDGMTWAWVQKIASPSGRSNFGASLAVDGEVLVVGAPQETGALHGSGAAYVYRFDGTAWVQEARLEPTQPKRSGAFGFAVALDGDRLIVAAPAEDGADAEEGAIYAFHRQAGNWALLQRLEGDGLSNGARFGADVALDGDALVAGAKHHDNGRGAAVVYRLEGDHWVDPQVIVPNDGRQGEFFGLAVAASHGVVAVTAPFADYEKGCVRLYERDNDRWTQRVRIQLEQSARFGHDVAMHEDVLAVASLEDRIYASGDVRLYRLQDGAAPVLEHYYDSDGSYGWDMFAASIDLADDTLVVGAFCDNEGNHENGAAYVFGDLVLRVDDATLGSGDRLELTTFGGNAQSPLFLQIVDPSDHSLAYTLLHDRFNNNGKFKFEATVPPGLSGLEVYFHACGVASTDRVRMSNGAHVTFE